jgi:hypothetical protein
MPLLRLSFPLALGLLLATPSAFAQTPVVHWSFDRVDKNTYPSSGSPPRPAAIAGTVSPAPGRAGQAASFSENPSGQILIPIDLATLARDGSFTLEFWLRPMGRSDQYGTAIDVGGNKGFVIRTNNSGRLSVSADSQWNLFASEFPLDEQIWAHVALVHKGGSGILYLNGRPLGSFAINLAALPFTLQVGSVLEKRRLADGGMVEEMTKTFVGDIDELKVHARALSPAEIAALIKPAR